MQASEKMETFLLSGESNQREDMLEHLERSERMSHILIETGKTKESFPRFMPGNNLSFIATFKLLHQQHFLGGREAPSDHSIDVDTTW